MEVLTFNYKLERYIYGLNERGLQQALRFALESEESRKYILKAIDEFNEQFRK